MNNHKNAILMPASRASMLKQIPILGRQRTAMIFGVSLHTLSKWQRRYQQMGSSGLHNESSRPKRLCRKLTDEDVARIACLRRERTTQRRITSRVGVSLSTISRVCAKLELSRLATLTPAPPVIRYEHPNCGDMLHLDRKRLARFMTPGHRATGNRRDTTTGMGSEAVPVAIDDRSRIAFSLITPDEKRGSATAFLMAAVAYYQRLGITIKSLLTDNGAAYRSTLFADTARRLGIRHYFTKPYSPQTNGKAERFIQTAMKEWAYGRAYQSSEERKAALPAWQAYFNHQRPHSALGYLPPISRLHGNNVLKLNS